MRYTYVLLIIAFSNYAFAQSSLREDLDKYFRGLDYKLSYSKLMEMVKSDKSFNAGSSNHELGVNGKDYFVGELKLDTHLGLVNQEVIRYTFNLTKASCGSGDAYNVLSTSAVSTSKKRVRNRYKELVKTFENSLSLRDRKKMDDKHLNDTKKQEVVFVLDQDYLLSVFCLQDGIQNTYVLGLIIKPKCL